LCLSGLEHKFKQVTNTIASTAVGKVDTKLDRCDSSESRGVRPAE
jgi:hypothetical protein